MVSHEMLNIRGCDRALYLREGTIRAQGEPGGVIESYLSEAGDSRDPRADEIGFIAGEDGKPRAEVTRVEWLDAGGQPLKQFTPGEAARARMHYKARQPVAAPIFALTLFHDDARFALHVPRHYLVHLYSGDAFKEDTLEGTGHVEVELEELHLPVGEYRAKAYLFEGGRMSPVYVRDGIARIECVRPEWSDTRALIDVKQQWKS